MGPLQLHVSPEKFSVAELVGLVPSRDLNDPAAIETARGALAEYGVICLRFDSALDKETFRRVAEMLGPIKDPVGRTKEGWNLRYESEMQVIDAGFVLTDELREQLQGISFGGLDSRRPG
ncbi:MAG TPA: hypothetical protein VMT89_13485, partial [Candidatus Acidoferrales bacterium]|nr:hypothetical protein [Candidatus Acidoferrales bacterium]